MPYTLHPATAADIPALVDLIIAAFASNAIIGQMMPAVPLPIRRARDSRRYQKEFARPDLNGFRFFKVVDEADGKMVAFAKWQYPYTLTAEQAAEKEEVDGATELWPEGANVELCEEFWGKLRAGRKKWIRHEKDFFLQLLVTASTHHRLGLGTMLIRQGLRAADDAHARTFIEATPMGLPLYQRHGWVEVDELVIDMRKYGGEEVTKEVMLIREARGGGGGEGEAGVGEV